MVIVQVYASAYSNYVHVSTILLMNIVIMPITPQGFAVMHLH